jgi:Holliday junction resolvase RusA-like endonuclease
MSVTVTLVHDEAPPSSNTNSGVGGRGNPHSVARTKGQWEGTFAKLLMMARVPRHLSKVKVIPRLEFRTATRRDGDNFYFAISKPLGDCLTKGGWLEDDTPDHYECERVRVEVGCKDLPKHVKSRMTLELTYE